MVGGGRGWGIQACFSSEMTAAMRRWGCSSRAPASPLWACGVGRAMQIPCRHARGFCSSTMSAPLNLQRPPPLVAAGVSLFARRLLARRQGGQCSKRLQARARAASEPNVHAAMRDKACGLWPLTRTPQGAAQGATWRACLACAFALAHCRCSEYWKAMPGRLYRSSSPACKPHDKQMLQLRQIRLLGIVPHGWGMRLQSLYLAKPPIPTACPWARPEKWHVCTLKANRSNLACRGGKQHWRWNCCLSLVLAKFQPNCLCCADGCFLQNCSGVIHFLHFGGSAGWPAMLAAFPSAFPPAGLAGQSTTEHIGYIDVLTKYRELARH